MHLKRFVETWKKAQQLAIKKSREINLLVCANCFAPYKWSDICVKGQNQHSKKCLFLKRNAFELGQKLPKSGRPNNKNIHHLVGKNATLWLLVMLLFCFHYMVQFTCITFPRFCEYKIQFFCCTKVNCGHYLILKPVTSFSLKQENMTDLNTKQGNGFHTLQNKIRKTLTRSFVLITLEVMTLMIIAALFFLRLSWDTSFKYSVIYFGNGEKTRPKILDDF